VKVAKVVVGTWLLKISLILSKSKKKALVLVDESVEITKEVKSSLESYGQFFNIKKDDLAFFENIVKKFMGRGGAIEFFPIDKEKSNKKEVFSQPNYSYDLFEHDILFPVGVSGYLRSAVLHHVFSKVLNLKHVVLPHGSTEGFDPRDKVNANEENYWEYIVSMPDENEKDDENSHFYCFKKAFGYDRPERFGEKESKNKLLVPDNEGNCNWNNLNRDRREMSKFFEKEYFNISKRDENARKVFVVFQDFVNFVVSRLLESNQGRLDSVIIIVLPHNNRLTSAGTNLNAVKSQQGKENYTKSQLIVDTYTELALEYKSLFNLNN